MLGIILKGTLAVGLALTGLPDVGSPPPIDPDEHQQLADSALTQVLRLISPGQNSLSTPFGFILDGQTHIWRDTSFSDLSSWYAEDDTRTNRFQVAQSTVLEQLSDLTSGDLDQLWNERQSQALDVSELPINSAPNNAVATYLVHHLLAIRFANLAAQKGAGGEAEFRAMLVYEAIAQGYLADALSSAHMLVPRHDFLPWIHVLNSKSAHTNYATEGVYVVNGMGVAYEAFGDGVLTYYGPNFDAAMQAARASLASVLYTYVHKSTGSAPVGLLSLIKTYTGSQDPATVVDEWLVSRNGHDYYSSTIVPGLLHIPTPVSAMWSTKDQGGRKYFQQLADQGHHDPDLPDYLLEHLHSADQVPDRFELGHLGSDQDIRASVDTVDTLASVEFIQTHRIHPSYHGIVFEVGGGALRADSTWNPAASVSLGYGFEKFLITKNVAVLGRATLTANDGPTLVTLLAAANIPSIPLRFEIGPATTTQDFWGHFGVGVGASWDLILYDLGFTYIGGMLRLRYDAKLLNGLVHGPSVQIVLH